MLADRTNHSLCWDTVSTWIGNCSKHETCQVSQRRPWLPTRLVDTIKYDKGRVRIVDSSRVSRKRRSRRRGSRRHSISYLALSHCWGLKPFLVMTEENKKEFEKGVPVSSLAPNFQDAIFVTRQLGFRYIWIDSLCIIQGSAEDWRREAPTMNQVYRNAFLTIGAMASPDAHGGLFRSRDPGIMGPCPIKIETEMDGALECLLVKSDVWESHVKQAPLSQRAWVVQERILAPRSLYFCEGQLFWECREQHACELFPKGVPLEFISDIKEDTAVDAVPIKAFEKAIEQVNALGSWASRMADDNIPWVINQYQDVYGVWNNILESYARCALTNPGDKFVAISGVAKDFAKAIDDEYLAGLWRRNFINGLLWTAMPEVGCEDDLLTVRPEVYRAPSWSWASLDAPAMEMPAAGYTWYGEYAEVLDVGIELASDDPTGALRHACLYMSGHLIKLRRRPARHIDSRHFGKFIPDVGKFEGENFYCLPLRENLVGERPFLMGLVLTPCPGDAEEEETPSCSKCAGRVKLRRVGVFRSEQGDPLRHLTGRKPDDWAAWGEESDHLWFPEDSVIWSFIIV